MLVHSTLRSRLPGGEYTELKQFQIKIQICREIRLPRYDSLWQILLCAMSQCGGFGYVLWATAADLVLRYGPLRRIWICAMGHCAEWSRTVKICIDFCCMGHSEGFGLGAMGHSTGFGYLLWGVAKDLVKCYGPWRSIWLCTMGNSAKPITIAQT